MINDPINNEVGRVEIAKTLAYHDHDGVNSPKIDYGDIAYPPVIPTIPDAIVGKMHAASAQVVQASLATIVLDTSDIAQGLTNSVGSYYIEILTTGYYYVGAQVRWDTISDGDSYWTYIIKNSTVIAQALVKGSAAGTLCVPTSNVALLTAGDKIYLKCSQTSGTDDYTIGGSTETFLTVFKIN